MSDAGPPARDPQEPPAAAAPKAAVPKKKPGMMADPVVRKMVLMVFALVIMFLVVVIGVALSGVTSPTGPRTLVENELAVSGAAVRSGKADAATRRASAWVGDASHTATLRPKAAIGAAPVPVTRAL